MATFMKLTKMQEGIQNSNKSQFILVEDTVPL